MKKYDIIFSFYGKESTTVVESELPVGFENKIGRDIKLDKYTEDKPGEFTIYATLYGRHVKTTVEQPSLAKAMEYVRSKINVVKVTPVLTDLEKAFESLKNIKWTTKEK